MKLNKKNIEKDKSGYFSLTPEDSEDMWHIYNLIQKTDLLRASSVRKVVSESDTGSTTKTSVRLTIQIQVEEIEFDVKGCHLRINGRNRTENDYIKV